MLFHDNGLLAWSDPKADPPLPYGISIARRGWLEKGDVLNALELPELVKRLGMKRKRAG